MTMNYSVVFEFEKDFDHNSANQWMKDNWKLTFYYSSVYILVIFLLRAFMQTRSKYELRTALTVWNMFLAVFSIFGAARTLPALIWALETHGWRHSVCDDWFAKGVTGYWTFLFQLSKFPELIDTIFIVLRKQKLIFLHWYHHVTVLIYCWYSYSESTGCGLWFVALNFTVHAMMYSYYAFRSMKYRVPRWVSVTVTSAQLLQMFIGIWVSYAAWELKSLGENCAGSYESLKYGFLMYSSYAVLFAHFFYASYCVAPSVDDVSGAKRLNSNNAQVMTSLDVTSTKGLKVPTNIPQEDLKNRFDRAVKAELRRP